MMMARVHGKLAFILPDLSHKRRPVSPEPKRSKTYAIQWRSHYANGTNSGQILVRPFKHATWDARVQLPSANGDSTYSFKDPTNS